MSYRTFLKRHPYAGLAIPLVVIAAALGLTSWGCTPAPDASLRAELQALATKTGAIEKQLAAIEADGKFTRDFAMRIGSDLAATIDPSEIAYATGRNKFGSFVVSPRSITPHLEGYKVVVDIGNLTGVTFHGAKLKMSWGPNLMDVMEKKITMEEFAAAKKQGKEISVTNVFRPGAYTTVEAFISPATAADVRHIEIGVEFNQLSLRP